MEESILITIKKMLGLGDDYEAFDVDVIIGINSALNALTQIGVGPSEGFMIHDKSSKWSEFIGDTKKLEMVKTYVYLKVKQVFDPGSGALSSAIDAQLKEYEWRISVQVDPGEV